MKKQKHEHLINNIKNTWYNRLLLKWFRNRIKKSNSANYLVFRGRGLNKRKANKDGYKRNQQGVQLKYASKISIYVRQ